MNPDLNPPVLVRTRVREDKLSCIFSLVWQAAGTVKSAQYCETHNITSGSMTLSIFSLAAVEPRKERRVTVSTTIIYSHVRYLLCSIGKC